VFFGVNIGKTGDFYSESCEGCDLWLKLLKVPR